MSWFLTKLLSSAGFKRNLAAVLAALYGIVSVIPELQMMTAVLEQIAAFFGITGIAHATGAGTLSKAKLSTISSVLSVLLFASQYIPFLTPYAPIIMKLASIIGALGAGAAISKVK